MKTTKIISIALLITMLFTMGLSNASANWHGQGAWSSLTEEERTELQNMTEEERKAYMEEKWVEIKDDDEDWIPNNQDEDFEKPQNWENKPEKAWNSEKIGSGYIDKGNGNSVLKAKYKNIYEEKYWAAISKMNDDQLNTFIDKVDVIIEKVEIWDYSDTIKSKYNAMLLALKEIAIDNIDNDIILDGLFD